MNATVVRPPHYFLTRTQKDAGSYRAVTVAEGSLRQPKVVVVVTDAVAVAVVSQTRTGGVCLSLEHGFVCD